MIHQSSYDNFYYVSGQAPTPPIVLLDLNFESKWRKNHRDETRRGVRLFSCNFGVKVYNFKNTFKQNFGLLGMQLT